MVEWWQVEPELALQKVEPDVADGKLRVTSVEALDENDH